MDRILSGLADRIDAWVLTSGVVDFHRLERLYLFCGLEIIFKGSSHLVLMSNYLYKKVFEHILFQTCALKL